MVITVRSTPYCDITLRGFRQSHAMPIPFDFAVPPYRASHAGSGTVARYSTGVKLSLYSTPVRGIEARTGTVVRVLYGGWKATAEYGVLAQEILLICSDECTVIHWFDVAL